jgi:hypothetical protein
MRKRIRRMAAAVALGAAVALSTAAPADAAIAVALSPTAGTAGTRVDVIASHCDQDATGGLENTAVTFALPKSDEGVRGHFTVTDDLGTGTYTVAVTCGSDTAAAKFTVTSGAGAATGGGSTAAAAATAVMWTGAAAVLIAVAGLWLLRRRSRIPAL